ncbi:MAG: OmpL47-type beta-barrel domain-containing protein [Brevinemataceae bacterium]
MKKSLLILSLIVFAIPMFAQQETINTNVRSGDNQSVQSNEQSTAGNVQTNQTQAQAVNASATNNAAVSVSNIGYTYSNKGNLYVSPKARFEIKADTNSLIELEAIEISINDSATGIYENPIAFTKKGINHLNYRFIDKLGNISPTKSLDVIVDSEAPVALNFIASPKPYQVGGLSYIGLNSKISFLAVDHVTGVKTIEYAVNEGEFQSYTNAVLVSELGYTTNSVLKIAYKAIDNVSNVSAIEHTSILLDANPPIVEIYSRTFETNGVKYGSSKESVLIFAFDEETAVDKILFAINDGEFLEYDTNKGIELPEVEGQVVIKAQVFDVVGNKTEMEYALTINNNPTLGQAVYIGEQRSDEFQETFTVQDMNATRQNVSESFNTNVQPENPEQEVIPANETTTTTPTTRSEKQRSGRNKKQSSQLSEEVLPGDVAPSTVGQ